MPETINFVVEEQERGWESLMAFLLLEGCTLRASDIHGDDPDAFDKAWGCSEGRFQGEALEVCLTVNSQEIPFRRTMELIEAQLDQLVSEKARELVRDVDCDLDNRMADLQGVLSDATASARALVEGHEALLHRDLGMNVMPWEPYTVGGDTLGFVSKGAQRRRHNGEKLGGVLKAPHWTWVDWWAANKSGQVRVVGDDVHGAVTLAKAIVDWRLRLGPKPEGFEDKGTEVT